MYIYIYCPIAYCLLPCKIGLGEEHHTGYKNIQEAAQRQPEATPQIQKVHKELPGCIPWAPKRGRVDARISAGVPPEAPPWPPICPHRTKTKTPENR